ncbi:MAG: ABC transporter permease [Rickettsiales bacterium]
MLCRRLGSLPVILLACIISIPTLSVFLAWLFPAEQSFAHIISQGLLLDYSKNSLIIASITGTLALTIGTLSAWAVTMWKFPASRLLSWLLVLPFAMPAYVAAMIYGHGLEGAGPIQTWLRESFNLAHGDYYFPAIRSTGGVIFILTITLYPYSYLLARGAFILQSRQMLDTAEMLGLNKRQLLTRVALPIARPALIVGVALIMMEALADYGVVSLYGISTFTTGMYRLWHSFYDPMAAARLASILLVFVLGLLWLEKVARRQARYDNSTAIYHPLAPTTLPSPFGWLVAGLCFVPVLLGFIIPACVLLYYSVSHTDVFFDIKTWQATLNAITVALLTALIATTVGLIFSYQLRSKSGVMTKSIIRIATSGYALPGTVIAVGTLLFLVTLQNDVFDGNIFIIGTIIGVVWACVMRFLTISFNATEAELTRITPSMDDAATMLGTNRWQILRHIHFPMLKTSLIIGFLLVFIDTLKELPATLLLRPFNFDTLAIRTYELASDDLLPHAAATGIVLVLISLVPVWLLKGKILNAKPMASYD